MKKNIHMTNFAVSRVRRGWKFFCLRGNEWPGGDWDIGGNYFFSEKS